MTTYIYTIVFYNENFDLEYKTIKGVYSSKEAAKEDATKDMKAQKRIWSGSVLRKLGKGKASVSLIGGCSKVYQIQEFEVK